MTSHSPEKPENHELNKGFWPPTRRDILVATVTVLLTAAALFGVELADNNSTAGHNEAPTHSK